MTRLAKRYQRVYPHSVYILNKAALKIQHWFFSKQYKQAVQSRLYRLSSFSCLTMEYRTPTDSSHCNLSSSMQIRNPLQELLSAYNDSAPNTNRLQSSHSITMFLDTFNNDQISPRIAKKKPKYIVKQTPTAQKPKRLNKPKARQKIK